MMMFGGLAALLVGAVLVSILPPLLRTPKNQPQDEARAQAHAALALLREQAQALDADWAQGRLSQTQYDEARMELERRVLEEGQAAAAHTARPQSAARGWAVAVGVLLPVIAGLIYAQLGEPRGLEPAQTAPHVAQEDQAAQQQVQAMVSKLEQRLEKEPQDIQGWQMLGRSYMVMGAFDKAAGAFSKLSALQPKSADALADWAEALLMAAEGKVQGEPEKLALRALALNPQSTKALALAGTAAYERQDYAGAAQYWEKLLAQSPPGSEAEHAIRAGVADARAKAGLPPLPETPSTAAAQTPLTLSGTLTLDERFKAQVQPDDIVFIFVRNPQGGAPLSAIKLKVSDLPYTFDFTQALRMGANTPGSTVTLAARIPKSGQPKASPGDLEGTLASVAPDAHGVKLQINTVAQ